MPKKKSSGKTRKIDTSFNFGANRKPRKKTGPRTKGQQYGS